MQFTGCVRPDGSVRLDDKPRWTQSLSKLKGKRIRLELETDTKRTSPQNRRFFGVVVPICREILNQQLEQRGSLLRLTKEETHEYLDKHYLGEVEHPVIGRLRRRCSELTTAEFSAFCDRIEAEFTRVWGADFTADEEMVREAGL